MCSFPVFPLPDPRAYLEVIERRGIPVVGRLATLAHLAITDPGAIGIARRIRSQAVASPLEITYWSQSPYWLGDASRSKGHAVKYSLVPRSHSRVLPVDPDREPVGYLRDALVRHLREGEALFDFKVQVQTDPETMKIEDASEEWDEGVSMPIAVGTLRIPSQGEDEIDEMETRCNDMSFSPWHALAAHRPMGGLNRLRLAVYEASFGKRTHS
jgi:hypothetical protein